MSTTKTIERSRLAAWGGALVVLMGVAWSIGPTHSRASEGTMGVLAQDQQAPTDQADVHASDPASATAGAILGELVGKDTRIIIHAGAQGPTYTLIGSDGQILATDLNAQQLRAQYPELPDPAQQLMLVDETGDDW